MGGVQLVGVAMDRGCDCYSSIPGIAVNWFATGADTTRLYLVMKAERLRASGVDRSFAAIVAVAADYMPEGALDAARQEGPIGYHANNDIWASQIAGNDVVLIGDAAGAPDPSQGHGTALLFRDVRELSDLLLAERDWPGAIAEFAERRNRYFAVIREYDRWSCLLASSATRKAPKPTACAKGTSGRNRTTRPSAASRSSRHAVPTDWSRTKRRGVRTSARPRGLTRGSARALPRVLRGLDLDSHMSRRVPRRRRGLLPA